MQRLFTPVPFIFSSEPKMMVSGSLGVWVGEMVGILVNMNLKKDQDPAYHHREILSEVLLL